MRTKFRAVLVTALAVSAVCGSASALTFSGTAYGQWVDVESSGWDYYHVVNNDLGGLATFNWGIPAGTWFNNQFAFDGAGSNVEPGWSAEAETPFLLGQFSYRNGSTVLSSGIEGIDLLLTLSITDPLGLTDSYQFAFTITDTPNYTGNPALDGDLVSVTAATSTTTFTYADREYALDLLGFSSDGGSTIRTDFGSPEGATQTAGLYARISDVTPADDVQLMMHAVPEPASIALLGLGLAGLVMRRVRKSS